MPKCIAIIPARGGSKRIPRKNIKLFHEKPLIAYSIEAALRSELFDKIIVSTDDEEISKIAKKYGAEVPFLRPKELSDDYTGTGAVVSHALRYLKEKGFEYDFCCTIYATAPLIDEKYIKQGFFKLKKVMHLELFLLLLCLFLFKELLKLPKMTDVKCFGLKILQKEVKI